MLDLNYKPEKVVDCSGLTEEQWLDYRRRGLGGSDISVLFGVNPWTTKRELYLDKTEGFRIDPPNPYTLDFGHAIEPFVAEWFEKEFHLKKSKLHPWLEKQMDMKLVDFKVRRDPFMYRHPLYPFLQADLDFLFVAVDGSGEAHEGVFECKTTNHESFMRKWGWNKVPEYYVWQCRHYMTVKNLPFTIIACAAGNNELDYAAGFIQRDFDQEENLITVGKDFWNNYVLTKTPPPLTNDPDLADEEFDNLLAYNMENGRSVSEPAVPLDPAGIDLCRHIANLKAQVSANDKANKEMKKQQILLETKLIDNMGGSTNGTGIGINGENVSAFLKITQRTGVDREKLQREYPDIELACRKVTESKSLNIKFAAAKAAS